MIAYALMMVLAFMSSVIIFLPSEAILLALASIDKVPPITMLGKTLEVARYSTDFPWLLPFAAAFGSNFGSWLYYLMGKGSLNISDKLRKKIESFDFERLGKGREAVIFVSGVASIPPVSATAIASGMIRFNFARYYAVSFAGKVVRYYLVLLIGRAAVETALKLF